VDTRLFFLGWVRLVNEAKLHPQWVGQPSPWLGNHACRIEREENGLNYFKTTVLTYSGVKLFTWSQPTSFELLLAKGHNWSPYTHCTMLKQILYQEWCQHLRKWKHLWCWCLGTARPNARGYLHVHTNHLGVVITKVRRSVTMLNNAMGVTDDRSTKVGHYIAMLAVV